MPKKLIIICHQPSENTRQLADSLLNGASYPGLDISATLKTPFETVASDVLSADALLLGTTENFGYMSGALKDFFDRIYYPCLEHTQGLPYALMVRAGLDGTGTVRSVERIVTGLGWNSVQPPLVCKGKFNPEFKVQCEELGQLLAVGVDAGVF